MILYIKHIDIEGPGTLGDFFERHGYTSRIINILDGDALPTNFDDVQAVISLGGPMNVYEEDKYPALIAENLFIQEVIARDIPFLGLCLGSQLLAKAVNARVVKSPVEEIGWYSIDLTDDPLFDGLDQPLEVFHWHGDMFDIPDNGRLIASSSGCPHQAFRVGKCAYGLQFHIEITGKSIDEWSKEYDGSEENDRRKHMLSRYTEIKDYYDNQARKLYTNFLKIIQDRQ